MSAEDEKSFHSRGKRDSCLLEEFPASLSFTCDLRWIWWRGGSLYWKANK